MKYELCQTGLNHLTTALHEKQFTTIGLNQTLTRFTAQKANSFSINHYDHAIAGPYEDIFSNDDTNANTQLTEKFFIKSSYVFTINCMNEKYDHIISAAVRDTKTYHSYFSKFNNFSLTFNLLTPKERDLHCSHQIKLRTKQTHTYTYFKFIQNNYTTTPSLNPHHRFQFINSKYTSTFFLNFTYCIKDTNMQGIVRNYDPIGQMYLFCPLTRTFNVDESRPLIVPHEYIQPVEVSIPEYIHNIKNNHTLFNLNQNTPHQFSPSNEEHKIIKALELLWPLLQTNYITRLLAKLLTTSNLIQDIFQMYFC